MSDKETCKRCGKEIEEGKGFEYVTPDFRVTLCGDCMNIVGNDEENDYSWLEEYKLDNVTKEGKG